MCSVSRSFCLTVLVSGYTAMASKFAVSNWKHCVYPDALIVTLWGVSLGTCIEECDKRPACLQYNYRKRRTSCELLSKVGQTPSIDKGCVSGGPLTETAQCTCSSGDVCSTSYQGPICYKYGCGPLSIANVVVYGNIWSKESRVKISCLSDKTMTTSTCQDNGDWAPLPTCPADCGSLTVENAEVSGTDWSEGSSVTIECLADNTQYTARCQNNGDWAPIPTCPADCGSLTIEHADVSGTDWSEGSNVTIVCQADNTLHTTTCQSNGDWAPLPTCPVECGPLTVENADVSGTDWSEGSNVTIECLADNTKHTATCQTNGDWAPLPTCPAVDSCPTSPKEFENIGNQKLKVCTFTKTQPEAANACQPYGGLVRIETVLQYSYIKRALTLQQKLYGGRDYWIQGQYDQDDNRWEFEDGESFPLHDSIHGDETGNGGTPCVRIKYSNYEMVDRNCSRTYAYICMLNTA